jgi:hypothetical protein
MGLNKGNTNNKEGRPKGIPNKITTELRILIHEFLSENWDQFKEDFEKLSPKDRAYFYEKLMQYDIPKMQSTQIISDQKEQVTAIEFTVIDPMKKRLTSESE